MNLNFKKWGKKSRCSIWQVMWRKLSSASVGLYHFFDKMTLETWHSFTLPFSPHTGSSREKSYSITVYCVAIFILKPLHCHFFTANQMIPRFLNYPFILEKQNIYFLVHLSWIQMQWNYSFKMNLNWTLSLISWKQVMTSSGFP